MKNCLLCLLCFVFLKGFSQKIDYKNFLSKQDLVFDSLSAKWEEGAFLGNGLLQVA